jgi:hypothetical protein
LLLVLFIYKQPGDEFRDFLKGVQFVNDLVKVKANGFEVAPKGPYLYHEIVE